MKWIFGELFYLGHVNTGGVKAVDNLAMMVSWWRFRSWSYNVVSYDEDLVVSILDVIVKRHLAKNDSVPEQHD